MKVLLAMPHVFSPKENSLYSSQTESKRQQKQQALLRATIGNLNRHQQWHWIHASLGKNKDVVNRELQTSDGVSLKTVVFTPPGANLSGELPEDKNLKIIHTKIKDFQQIPLGTSRYLLENCDDYDMIAYIEDDIVIQDPYFFTKIEYLVNQTSEEYAFIPHRCEHIPGKGDVILSGDPDGGRPDLFWDTGEKLTVPWPLGSRVFYRATNPHSGCYFLTRSQAQKVRDFWVSKNWKLIWSIAGPLESAASGVLIPVLKVMKPIPEHYRFLMVRHQDSLWLRHAFETQPAGPC